MKRPNRKHWLLYSHARISHHNTVVVIFRVTFEVGRTSRAGLSNTFNCSSEVCLLFGLLHFNKYQRRQYFFRTALSFFFLPVFWSQSIIRWNVLLAYKHWLLVSLRTYIIKVYTWDVGWCKTLGRDIAHLATVSQMLNTTMPWYRELIIQQLIHVKVIMEWERVWCPA